MNIHNKNILITGASSGIGRELAMQLAKQGNRLFLVSRRTALLEGLANTMPNHSLGHKFFSCDVTQSDQWAAVHEYFFEQAIRPDVLILNAGIGGGFNAAQINMVDMRRQVEVNFWGVVQPLSLFLPEMIKHREGLVAVMGSLAGYRGLPNSAPYSISKAALAILVECLRIDLYKSGIHFTLISPGFVKTPMTDLNRFPMPFLMPVEKAARIIIRGLEKKKTEIHFPYRLSLLVKAAQWLPNKWYARALSLHRQKKTR